LKTSTQAWKEQIEHARKLTNKMQDPPDMEIYQEIPADPIYKHKVSTFVSKRPESMVNASSQSTAIYKSSEQEAEEI
jgi:hypothetical protein